MPYPALAVANYFIYQGGAEGDHPDPLKLQKLIYFANGWHLALVGPPLIAEPIRAWKYGPVIPTVYHAFKEYGSRPITEPHDPEIYDIPERDSETRDLLKQVWNAYGSYSGIKLSNLSHDRRGPWARRATSGSLGSSPKIPSDEIRDYFKSLIGEVELGAEPTASS